MDFQNKTYGLTLNERTLKDRVQTFGLRDDIYFFIENLSALLSAGMSVVSALASIQEELTSKRMKAIAAKIETDVTEGKSLSQALADARILSNHMLSLIRLGEVSG